MKFTTVLETIKLILIIVIIGSIVLGGISAYSWIKTKLEMQEEKLKLELIEQRKYFEIKLNQVRAETNVVNANSNSWKSELTKLKKQNSELISLLKKNDEKITNIGGVIAQTELNKLSDHVYKEGTGDQNEQYFKKIYVKAKTKDGQLKQIPIAWAIFYPNRPADKKWKTGVYPIEYKTKIVQAEQQNGNWNTYIETWAENNKDKASRGIQLPIEIKSAEFKQVRRKTKDFYIWSPHINLNLDVSSNNIDSDSDINIPVYGGISFSTSGYGRTKNDLTWRFIDFGISTNGKDIYAKFTPVLYNIGEPLPIISNTFIGPFIGLSTESDKVIGLGVSIPF